MTSLERGDGSLWRGWFPANSPNDNEKHQGFKQKPCSTEDWTVSRNLQKMFVCVFMGVYVFGPLDVFGAVEAAGGREHHQEGSTKSVLRKDRSKTRAQKSIVLHFLKDSSPLRVSSHQPLG